MRSALVDKRRCSSYRVNHDWLRTWLPISPLPARTCAASEARHSRAGVHLAVLALRIVVSLIVAASGISTCVAVSHGTRMIVPSVCVAHIIIPSVCRLQFRACYSTLGHIIDQHMTRLSIYSRIQLRVLCKGLEQTIGSAHHQFDVSLCYRIRSHVSDSSDTTGPSSHLIIDHFIAGMNDDHHHRQPACVAVRLCFLLRNLATVRVVAES